MHFLQVHIYEGMLFFYLTSLRPKTLPGTVQFVTILCRWSGVTAVAQKFLE